MHAERTRSSKFSCAALLLALAAAIFGMMLAARPAEATTLRSTMMSLGDPEKAPTLGAGYVYWTSSVDSKTGSKLPTSTVHQRRLSDGRERILLRAKRTTVTALYAEGDKVAFSTMRIRRVGSHKRTTLLDDRVYAMSAEDAAPTLVADAPYFIRVSIKIRHRGQRKITLTSFEICGKFNELFDVNADGQVLVDESEYRCKKNNKPTQKSEIYSLSGATPIRVHSVGESLTASVQFGNLISNPFDTVDVTNFATGKKRRLAGHLLVDQVLMDKDGYIVTVSEDDDSFDHSYIRIYSPGASKPAVKIKRKSNDFPSVVFCAGGIVELSEPRRGGMLLTLRGFDGKVISRRKGPRTGLDYDASCEGRRLTLAVMRGRGKPSILGYDL